MMPEKVSLDRFDLVQIVCMDMNGLPKGKLVPRSVAHSVVNKGGYEMFRYIHTVGQACDMPTNIPEITQSSFDNGIFQPLPETLVELPWVSQPGMCVGQMIGYILGEDGQVEETTVRYQVEKQLRKLELLGMSLLSSFRCQFTVFKAGINCKEFLGQGSRQCSSPYGSIGCEEIMLDLCDQLRTAGVDVDSWSSRPGRGAFELSVAATEGVQIADMAARLKHGVRSFLAGRGYHATFMAKPHEADLASTLIFSFTLNFSSGKNAFYDASKKDNLSDMARSWLAGMIGHGEGMTALLCPNFNCYQRFTSSAPTRLSWDLKQSSSFLQAKIQAKDETVWLETSLPSAASNVYFLVLACLASGLRGLEEGLACPQKSSVHAKTVPSSLELALAALEADKLLASALSPIMLKAFVSIKMASEVKRFKDLEETNGSREQFKALEDHFYLTRI